MIEKLSEVTLRDSDHVRELLAVCEGESIHNRHVS